MQDQSEQAVQAFKFVNRALPTVVTLIMVVAVLTGCGSNAPPDSTNVGTSVQNVDSDTTSNKIGAELKAGKKSGPPKSLEFPYFKNVAGEVGIEFVYDTGANGRALMVESTGGGAAWIDFDRDGYSDLFLVQGGNPTEAIAHPAGNQIMRNLQAEKFVNISLMALPEDVHHAQGIAVGDFDDDGFDDVYITNVGPNQLLKNLGDGTFEDVTELAGVGDERWSTSAAWADLDLDGDLDLFVCNYTKYNVFNPQLCQDESGRPRICHPNNVEAQENQCYENLGNGKFRPVLHDWGLHAENGKSLGVVVADFNNDRLPDIFVANDVMANHLFVSTAPGKFEEQGVVMGCAMSQLGQFQASMGVATGDYDNNGFLDLYVAHFTQDSNTLYQNLGDVGFSDVTRTEGLHQPTLDFLGFGTVMQDFNRDGNIDLFVANGHIDDWSNKGEAWRMTPQLFTYANNRWWEGSQQMGEFAAQKVLGRAVAQADYDNDGDPDLAIAQQFDDTALLQNQADSGHWLSVEAIGHACNRRAIGATFTLKHNDGTLYQQLTAGGSYCATHQPRLFFGLGDVDGPYTLEVSWPRHHDSHESATTESFEFEADQHIVLRQGASPLPGSKKP